MEDKYRARGLNNEEVMGEESQINEKEMIQESTEKAVDVAGTVALDYATGGAFSKVKNTANKIPIVREQFNKQWDNNVKGVSNIVSKTPLGKNLKQLDDAGVTDMTRGAVDMASGAQGGGTPGGYSKSSLGKPSKNADSKGDSSSGKKSFNLDKLKKKKKSGDSKSKGGKSKASGGGSLANTFSNIKMKLIIFAVAFFGVIFLCIITAIASKDMANMDITNGTDEAGGVNGNSGGGMRACTDEELEGKLVYVGDSRTVGMKDSLGKDKINYIAESSMGYDWFNNTALPQIESKIEEKSDSVIVLSLGINDLANIDNYISAYKALISKYYNNKFYVLSVNPVDETKTVNNGYTVTNADIDSFNQKLKDAFPNNYIDTNGNLSDFVTGDGIHYDNNTYSAINDEVVSKINNSGDVMCGGGGSFDNCALTVEGDKYYKKVRPLTEECNVPAFPDNSFGLEPNFYTNLQALMEDGKSKGCNTMIISGHRTFATQKYLYNCYRTKSCNNGNLAAVPGTSNHEYGIAADLRYLPHSSKCVQYYHSNASKYGLVYSVASEDWHIEPINIIRANQ